MNQCRSEQTPKTADIINKYGGMKEASLSLRTSRLTIQNWKMIGIPCRYWPQIMQQTGTSLQQLFDSWLECNPRYKN